MGLGDSDPGIDKGARAEGGVTSTVPCSICLETVMDTSDRSTAKLQCGHQFHLDCIGSAFNAKGVMQCPNCRKVEKGNWLYANGYRSFPEISTDDWVHDEDLYDLNYSEIPYGVHWCPFSRLARAPSSFEEGESSPSISYQELLGHHAVFAEHPATSLGVHSCPYIAYFHPLQPSSSSSSQVSTESVIDGPTFHHHWSSLSGPVDMQPPHPFPAVDIHYHGWEPHSPPYSPPSSRVGGAEQAPVSSSSMRTARIDTDSLLRPGSFLHPFLIGHGSASRASSSVVSSMVPPYPGNSRAQAHAHEIRVSYQHHNAPGGHAPIVSGVRRSGVTRGVGQTPPSSDHSGLYLFPPTASSRRSPQDSEITGGNHFYAWERDRFAPFPLMPVERDLAWWGPLPQVAGASDSGSRTGFWHQHNSERSSSQGRVEGSSHRPAHPPRMYPFI